jgi:uncharacterized protein (DUF433 family)
MERVHIRLNRTAKNHAARPLNGAKPACLIPACLITACLITGGTIAALAERGSRARLDPLSRARTAGNSMRGKSVNPLLQRITIDPRICGGKPCIKGTRIWVSLVLDFLAEGMTEAELLAEYPGLTHEDVLAAIAYGAEVARERVIPVPTESAA